MWMFLIRKKLTHFDTHCSGLTYKTSLSFTSSNSSFSECVRHSHHRFNHFILENSDNPPCSSETIYGRCTYRTTGPSLSGSGPFLFTDTDFILCKHNGENVYGGAIDCTEGDLTITRCSFLQCSCSNRGGAVSFRSDGKCNQEDNLYLKCSADVASGAFDSYEWGKSPNNYQNSCTFIGNSANLYYGHICIEYSADICVDSNMYIRGSSHGEHDACAGSVAQFTSSHLVTYSNCIFSKGSANSYGGGIGTYEPYESNASPYFYFSYFSNNVCSDQNRGADFDANGTTGNYFSEDKIIHCFSSSRGLRIHIGGQDTSDVDNWLP